MVLDIKRAGIDQLAGVEAAISMGKKSIAVTVRGDQDQVLKKIRQLEDRRQGDVAITVLSVCNTGISKKQADAIKRYSDIAWACSSRYVWEAVGPESILQLGMKIPVFVLTGRGISFISGYSEGKKIKDLDLLKKHYVTMNRFEPGGIKMDLGRFSVYLYETDKLPLHTSDEPRPLH
jgi:hypothetical protein